MRVIVLGGGISGLAAAFYLRKAAAGSTEPLEITVLEQSSRFGGCLQTVHEDGYLVELGPDSIVTHKPWAMDIVRELGLESELTSVLPNGKAGVLRGRHVQSIPSDFRLFTPGSVTSFATSGLLSFGGMLRAAGEVRVPRRREDSDESLASFVTRRFGREVLDRLAQPLLGGIYSGDPRHLSMQATLPEFLRYEQTHGSLVRAIGEMRRANGAPTKKSAPFVTLARGLGSIVRALEGRLAGALRSEMQVTSARRVRAGDGRDEWNVTCADGSVQHADALVCAVSPPVAARILQSEQPALAQHLATIAYSSVATVTMGFDETPTTLAPSCYGFVVPYVERRSITAGTIVNRKYGDRAPKGKMLVRAFVGGALQPEMLDLDDKALTNAVLRDLDDIAGIQATPHMTIVQRWMHQFPEYRVGHVDLIEKIEREADALPNFALAGAAYHGAGIADCIHSGKVAAERIAALQPR